MIQETTRAIYKSSLKKEAERLLAKCHHVIELASNASPDIADEFSDTFLHDTEVSQILFKLKGTILGATLDGHDTFTVTLDFLSAMVALDETLDAWSIRLS